MYESKFCKPFWNIILYVVNIQIETKQWSSCNWLLFVIKGNFKISVLYWIADIKLELLFFCFAL